MDHDACYKTVYYLLRFQKSERGGKIKRVWRGDRRTRGRMGNDATGKAKLECNGLIHPFFKFDRIGFRLLCGDPDGLLAYHISGPVDRVDADVHHGTASSHILV